MANLTDAQRQFLEQPIHGIVTTLRKDGSPHNTVVWVDVVDGKPSFNTATGRAKPRHLDHDERVGLVVLDPNDPYKWLAVDGRAEITTEGANDQIDKLAKKYTGADRYQNHQPGEERLSVRIRPEHVTARGLD
ncbi:MAG TPA: PPOX class F420-dependent oxidoreductase [Gaiellaceae bacterium]|nr:PPOX class F420-dependent oxidoreductase [Gaiellaceae bacterium]